MRKSQLGLGGALIAVVLVIAAVIALATLALTRQSASSSRGAEVAASMKALHEALAQHVAANGRLPCPADPTTEVGSEVVGGAAGTCTHTEGTVPWLTIGARRESSIDPWGAKFSYRVYTGASGSLTQTGGASMVECDTVETTPATATTVTGSSGGLCRSDTRVTFRDTLPASYLAGKGLSLADLGTNRTDVAYVLVSHGPTGLGAYSSAGVRRDLPAAGGSERANTTATGPFVIKAFSDAGTDPATSAHFDDFVSYRGIEELIRAAGVYARDWPEESTVTATFNRATVEAAVGSTVTAGSGVGQVSVTFAGVVASGVANGTATQVAFDQAADGSWAGIGVAGGGNALLQSSANEVLRFETERASKFAVTLTNLGFYSGDIYEIVQFRFFNNGADLGVPRYGVGCNIDGEGTLASFSMDVGTIFDRVDVTPIPAFDLSDFMFSGITAVLVSEIKACPASEPTCVTSLTTPGNTCPVL